MVIRRTSGLVVELSTVYVAPNTRPRRNKRKGTTTAEKQDENEKNCVKVLARWMNCNYAYGDLLLTLKYDNEGLARVEQWAEEHQEEGQPWEDAVLDAAEREGKNALRRMKREFDKAGIPFRSLLVTSDRDGKTGTKPRRVHHHVLVPRLAWETVAKKWGLGTVDYQILPAIPDFTPIAAYWMRQVRRREGKKKYTPSRNLKPPVVNQRWAKPGEVLKPDRRGNLVDRNEWTPGAPQYIRFVKAGAEGGRQEDGEPMEFSDTARRERVGASCAGTSEAAEPGGTGPGVFRQTGRKRNGTAGDGGNEDREGR